jgi:hypothetical protein
MPASSRSSPWLEVPSELLADLMALMAVIRKKRLSEPLLRYWVGLVARRASRP